MSHPVDPLRRALAGDPSRPLVTFYDDATGERVEFSAKTFDNWVAKTANLLIDGLGTAPGDRVALALPPHWQTAVWLFACWSAGAVAVPVSQPTGDVDVLVVGPDLVDAAADSGAPEVVGLSLHALGAPLPDCPPGVTDYAVEVRAYGDRFSGEQDPDVPAVELAGQPLTGAELMAAAESSPAAPGARVLTTAPFTTREGLLAGLLSPLSAGGSVIICQNIDERLLDQRISVEHVTALVRPGSAQTEP